MTIQRPTTKLLAVVAIMAGLSWAPDGGAATITYLYSGTVNVCPNTGIPPCGVILFEGDIVSGPFVVDALAATPDGSIDFSDVLSFSVMVGEFFAVDSNNSSLVDGSVDLDGAGNVVGGFLTIFATALPDAPPTEVILDFDTNSWLAQALVPNVPDPVFIASGSGGLKQVPIPGALALFVPALLALGTVRRRGSD